MGSKSGTKMEHRLKEGPFRDFPTWVSILSAGTVGVCQFSTCVLVEHSRFELEQFIYKKIKINHYKLVIGVTFLFSIPLLPYYLIEFWHQYAFNFHLKACSELGMVVHSQYSGRWGMRTFILKVAGTIYQDLISMKQSFWWISNAFKIPYKIFYDITPIES